MNKRNRAITSILISIVICWQFGPAAVRTVHGGLPPTPCSSSVYTAGGCFFVCPQGDGPRLDALPDPFNPGTHIDARIFLQIKNDVTGAPIPGIPASDFWLVGCEGGLSLCGIANAIDADSATNADGRTTISGSLAASGYDTEGVSVVVQGVVLWTPECTGLLCLPLTVLSPDLEDPAAGVVDLLDLTAFSFGYPSPPRPYTEYLDFTCDGQVDLLDLTLMAFHYLHRC